MKYILQTVLLVIILSFSACGEDRSHEFYALIEDKVWIEETMREHYLWYDQIPTIENEYDYFKGAETFFKSLLATKAINNRRDSYSYMEDNSENSRAISLGRESTYGIEFELTNDPLGSSTRTFAHVLYVLPNSPAASAGIKRGDWITSINKDKITSDNYRQLQSGESIQISIDKIVETTEGLAWQAVDTISLGASLTMEINPFLVDSVYEVNGQKIAYLVYNEFATGPNNDGTETTYNEQMKQIFTRFKAQQPDALILDLRYNTGGYLHCAQALGSMVAPESALGKDFIKLQFNDKAVPQTQNYTFDNQYESANLNLSEIYILTSTYTASASEALINGLIPYMGQDNIITLGEKTVGKNVAMAAYKNDTYGYTLWPVVAYVFNANNEGDYSEGITPRYPLNEDDYSKPWYPLGDTQEILLKNTLSLITTGSILELNQVTSNTNNIQSSISNRRFQGMHIQ